MADGVLSLGREEVQTLIAVSRRQLAWEPRMPVRLRTTGTALGLYTAPPLNVLALFAVPATVSGADGDVDAIIPLASFLTALEITAANGSAIDLSTISEATVPIAAGVTVANLPPADGWHLPIQAVSGDLLPSVQDAVAEFTRRSAGQPELLKQQIADEIWNRQTWAALPMRMLHAAAKLGMLTSDRSRVSAAVNGPWKRLSTPRGHVLATTSGATVRLPLDILG